VTASHPAKVLRPGYVNALGAPGLDST
jgi:hypothetical protein